VVRRPKPLAEDVIRRLEAIGRGRRMDPELLPTDRLLRRWAVSIGDGLPSDEWQDNSKSRVPPLDEDTAVKVDQIILRSPERTTRLVRLWYKSNQPAEIIAERVGVSRSAIFVQHKAALSYLRGRFHGVGIDC
jgi:hypothetical protein